VQPDNHVLPHRPPLFVGKTPSLCWALVFMVALKRLSDDREHEKRGIASNRFFHFVCHDELLPRH
jgi:hypothetical protein